MLFIKFKILWFINIIVDINIDALFGLLKGVI